MDPDRDVSWPETNFVVEKHFIMIILPWLFSKASKGNHFSQDFIEMYR